MKVLIGISLLAIFILSILVIFLYNQVRQIYYIIFATSGLQIGQKVPQLESSLDKILKEEGEVYFIFAGLECDKCIQVIREMRNNKINHNNLYVLTTDKQEDINNFERQESIDINLLSISEETKGKFQVIFEPFYFSIQEEAIKAKGILESPKVFEELLN